MSKHNLYEIASDLCLWNEYFNTSALMTDAEFRAMTVAERLRMLIAAFGVADEGRNELAASDDDGVYVCENGTRDVLEDMAYYDALATDADVIYGNVCDSVAALIEAEYGIR